MEIKIEKLNEILQQKLKNIKNPIIAVDGFAGSGKTTLAKTLNALIPNSLIIETDQFIKYSRKVREDEGYPHSSWYDLHRIHKLFKKINSFEDNFAIELDKIYSHISHAPDSTINIRIKSDTIIIFEGMYSHHKRYGSFTDLKIFLTCNFNNLLNRFIIRDKKNVGISAQQSLKRFLEINGFEYFKYLTDNKRKPDIEFYINDINEFNNFYPKDFELIVLNRNGRKLLSL